MFVVAGASAASPKRDGVYVGRTSQGASAYVEIEGRRKMFFEAEVTSVCGRLGKLQSDETDSGITVRRDGSFSHTALSPNINDEGYVIGGRRQILAEVIKTEISGSFITSRRVTGTWRVRSAFFSGDRFPDSTEPVDKCDTGVLAWSARLRRRR